jgi:hypothetical protein
MTADDHYHLKQLRLAPMDVVNACGIPAESPVFISSKIDKPQRCGRCGVIYSALIYQTDHISYSHHYHDDVRDNEVGIFFFAHRQRWLYDVFIGGTGWIAAVEPLGKTWFSPRYDRRRCGCRYGIAEAVRVVAIHARCYAYEVHDDITRVGCFDAHNNHRLEHGLLLPLPYGGGELVPICHKQDVPVAHAPLQFHITDGQVFFSRRE